MNDATLNLITSARFVLNGTARDVRDLLEMRRFDADDLRALAADLRKDADELERIANDC